HGQLNDRRAVVRRLEGEKATLERRLASSTSPATLAREARAMGYVKPGERLYIVKGIEQWRRRGRATMVGPGARWPGRRRRPTERSSRPSSAASRARSAASRCAARSAAPR